VKREWWRPPQVDPLPVTPPDHWTYEQRKAMLAWIRHHPQCSRCGRDAVYVILTNMGYKSLCERCRSCRPTDGIA
jgi:NADH pyrophosphatase NudC (nudix superfamily)